MKTFSTNYPKTLCCILLFTLFLSACAQSKKEYKEKETIAPPEIELQTAVISGNLEAVKQHIASGTDINKKDAMSNSTPLMTAATFGNIKIAKALIDAKADLTVKNNDGGTALHNAAFFCRVEIVQLLIDAKADKTIKNNYGMTARESALVPFTQMKPVYKMLQQQLSPLGLQLNLNEIEKTRPVIAMMLQ